MKNIIDENEMSLATLTDGTEKVEAELLSVADYEEITLSQQKKEKQAIANLKQRVMLTLDKEKLDEAQKLLSGIKNISDIFSDPEVMYKIKNNIKGPMDLKFLAESYAKLIDSQQKLMRLDSLDGEGNAAKLSLAVQFKGANGSEVKTFITAEG